MSRKVIRSPRLARKEQKRKTRKTIALLLLACAVFLGVLYGFSRKEFRITSVDVSGVVRVPEGRVRGVVEAQLAGTYFGLIPKSHSLLYPKSALKETLTREFPTFSSVSVSLNNLASLRVSVREREPFVLWCPTAQPCFLLDETGFVFAEAEPGTENLYYRMEKEATTTPLGTVVLPREKLTALMFFLGRLEKLGLTPEKVRFLDGQELHVFLHGGMRLLLNENEFERSLTNIETLLSEKNLFPKQGGLLTVEYIDLRYGNKVYFKSR
ncbi:MAG: hypothetical protein EXS51_02225 [Candidatus Taylorbacteria bacterium]|nr:hypothetical protein [Candidatus Taylorbacteria bacterium]